VVARDKKVDKVKKDTGKRPLTEEDKELRDYEMVIIISPELDEVSLNAALDNISKHITDMGGVIANIEKWGKRKLAYPIKLFSEGYYILTKFQLQPAMVKEVNVRLQISEEVIRHLMVRLNS